LAGVWWQSPQPPEAIGVYGEALSAGARCKAPSQPEARGSGDEAVFAFFSKTTARFLRFSRRQQQDFCVFLENDSTDLRENVFQGLGENT